MNRSGSEVQILEMYSQGAFALRQARDAMTL